MAFEKKQYFSNSFVDELTEKRFVFAGEEFSKQDLIDELGVGSFIAAARASNVLQKLGIETIPQLRKMDPISLLRKKGFGQGSMHVVMCFLDMRGVDVGKWWGWKEDGNDVKFSSFQARAKRRAKKRIQ